MKDEYEVHVVEFTQYFLGFNVQRKRIIEMLGEDNFHTLGGLEYQHGNQTYDEYVEKRMGLWELIKKIKPDVVHFNEVPELFLDLVNPHRGLPEELGKKIYSEDRDYLIFETTHDSMWDAKNNKVWLPDKFLFVSNWHVKVYEDFNIPMEVIDISIEKKDRPNRSEVLEELGFDPEYKHVLNVGLWSSRKNQGEIVDIAKLMVNDKVMFHFIGNLSADFIDYWEKCMVDLPDSCVVHDERDDVDKFCSCMDLFLFTSRGDDSDKETNPIVLKEALSWQMPIMLYNLDVYLGMYDDEESMTFLTGDKYKDIENIRSSITWK
jgi:glycosyltransferase involved in cell wall biosynthesis